MRRLTPTSIPVTAKLVAIAVIAIAAQIVAAVSAERSIREVSIGSESYQAIADYKDLNADFLPPPLYLVEANVVALSVLSSDDAVDRNARLAALAVQSGDLRSGFEDRLAVWAANDTIDDETRLLITETAAPPGREFLDLLEDELIPLVRESEMGAAEDLFEGPMSEAYQRHRNGVDQIVERSLDAAAATETGAKAVADDREQLILTVLFGTLAVLVLLIAAIAWSVFRPLRRLEQNLTTIADGATGVASSINVVVTASEEMESAISEISRAASEAVDIAETAMAAADRADQIMDSLGASSGEITDVVRAITGIAEQTNLLALNATIEAARAGEAGRGFAVVASEVKNLAGATAGATGSITQRINAMRQAAENAVVALQDIRQIIARISDAQNVIAAAVEEQTVTTSQIKDNVVSSATAADDISTGVQHAARQTRELSGASAGR